MTAATFWTPPRAPAPPEPEGPWWDLSVPPVLQTANWTCSCASAAWVLRCVGLPLGEWDVVATLRALHGYQAVTEEYGLAYADMHQLADVFDYYGWPVNREIGVSWERLREVAGTAPAQINGARWGHHSGLRGYDGTALLLANPAPSWQGVGQELDANEYLRWGTWNLLYIKNP